MKRKITRFALGAKWGSFGASGSVEAARARPAPSPANARAPNPQALSCRNRRRLRNSTVDPPENSRRRAATRRGTSALRLGVSAAACPLLVHVAEFGGREERVEDRRPRGLARLRGAQVARRE